MKKGYAFMMVAIVFIIGGCEKDSKISDTKSYGQDSFIICTDYRAEGPVGFGPGSYTVMGKQTAQGAVIVVAAPNGLTILGESYPFRTVVLFDENGGSSVARKATPEDNVMIKNDLTIFGKNYKKGKLTISQNGMLPE